MTMQNEREAIVATKHEARRWVRAHWAALIKYSDMGAVGDMDEPLIEEVWDDECTKIASRLTRGDHLKGQTDDR